MSTVIESYAAEVGIKFNLNLATRAGYFDAVRAGEHHTQHWWDTGLRPRYGHRARSTTPPTPMAARTATAIVNEEMDALILAGSSTASALRNARPSTTGFSRKSRTR